MDSVCTVVVNAAAAADGAAEAQVLALDLSPRGSSLHAAAVGVTEMARLMHMAAGHAADLESILRPS